MRKRERESIRDKERERKMYQNMREKDTYLPPHLGHPGPPSAWIRDVSMNLSELD